MELVHPEKFLRIGPGVESAKSESLLDYYQQLLWKHVVHTCFMLNLGL